MEQVSLRITFELIGPTFPEHVKDQEAFEFVDPFYYYNQGALAVYFLEQKYKHRVADLTPSHCTSPI